MLPLEVDLGFLADDGVFSEVFEEVGDDEYARFFVEEVNGSDESSGMRELGSALTAMAEFRQLEAKK